MLAWSLEQNASLDRPPFGVLGVLGVLAFTSGNGCIASGIKRQAAKGAKNAKDGVLASRSARAIVGAERDPRSTSVWRSWLFSGILALDLRREAFTRLCRYAISSSRRGACATR